MAADKTFSLLAQLSLNDEAFKNSLKGVKENVKSLMDGVEGASGNINEMRKALMALKNVSFAGKSVEEIAAINKQIGTLTDDINDLKAVQKGLGTEFGTLAAEGLQGFVAMAQAATGVGQLFGMSKDSAEQFNSVMTQFIGIAQAAATIQNVLEAKTYQAIAAKLKDISTTVGQTIATQAATAAQWALNASILVLIGTIGIIVVAVAALTAGIYLLVKSRKEENDEIERNQRLLAKKKAMDEMDLQDEEQKIRLLKARGASQIEVLKAEIASLELLQKKRNTQERFFDIQVKKVELERLEKEEIKKKADELKNAKGPYDLLTESITNQETAIKNLLATGGYVSPEMIRRLEQEKEKLYVIEQTLNSINNLSKQVKPITLSKKELTEVFVGKEYKGADTKGLEVDKLITRNALALSKFNTNLEESKEKFIVYQGALQQGFYAIGDSIVNSFGLASDGIEGFAGVLLKFVVDSIAMYLGTSIAAAIAGAEQSGAATGPLALFTTPAFIAQAIATVLTAFATIPKFAYGGIVPGSVYSGDRVPVMANSGEMILNAGQQSNLFNLLNGSIYGDGKEVQFKIKGSDLYGVLNNYSRKINAIR